MAKESGLNDGGARIRELPPRQFGNAPRVANRHRLPLLLCERPPWPWQGKCVPSNRTFTGGWVNSRVCGENRIQFRVQQDFAIREFDARMRGPDGGGALEFEPVADILARNAADRGS
jgi:hypothetical protein